MALSLYIISEKFGQDPDWILVLILSLVMLLGLAVFLGEVRIYFPFIFMEKEDLSAYNVEKISFVLGILMIAASYPLVFMTMGGLTMVLVVCVAFAAMELAGVCVSVMDRFRADTQPEH